MIDNKKLNNKVVSGVSWKLAERIFSQGIAFIVTIILARLLTPNDYGVVAMVNVFVIIADIIISSGFTAALIQKKDASDNDYSTIFFLNLIISFVLYIVLFFCAPAISRLYEMDSLIWVLRVIALKLPLSALYSVQSAHVSRNMNFKIFFFSTLFGSVISAIVGIVMAKLGFGVWALVAQQLVALFVGTLIMCFTVKWRPKLIFSKKSLKETCGYGTRIMATDVIGSVFNQLNAFIIGLFYTSEDLAYYTKGQNLPNMATNIAATSFVSVLFPAMSSLVDEKDKLKNLLRSATRMFTFIVFPILFGIFIVSSDLISVLYGAKWSSTTIFLQIMCISGLISMLGEFDILTLKSLGKSKTVLILEFIKKPIFVIITIIAIQFGVVWIAASMILINIIALFVNTYAVKREIQYSLFNKLKDCLNSIILSLFMIAAVYVVSMLPIDNIVIRLLFKIFVGMLVYFVLALLTKNKEFKAILQFLKNKLSKKNKQTEDNTTDVNNIDIKENKTKMRKLLRFCKRMLMTTYRKMKSFCLNTFLMCFYLIPIKKNKITFNNFDGKGYGDNPKYLAEEFLKDKKYEIIWFVNNLNEEMPEGIKKVKFGSLSHYYHMITAKLWIENVRGDIKPLFKRKKQCYVQTWHGGAPIIKGVEKDVEEFLPKDYIKSAKRDSKFADYFISNGKYQTEMFRNSFWYNGEVLEFGEPKSDCLSKPDINKINDLKKKYNISGKKIVLYAPSFRNDKTFYDKLYFDVEKLLDVINTKFKDDYILCLRLHPNDENLSNIDSFKNCIDLTQEEDANLVLVTSDIVISDYSTMGMYFALTNKPTFIYAPDYDYYIQKERKLYVDLENYKLPFAKDFDTLLNNVKEFDNKKYLHNIKLMREEYSLCDNIDSSKKIKEYLQDKKKI